MLVLLQEHEGKEVDSITKLHLDMADALNWLGHYWRKEGDKVTVRCGIQHADPDNA